MHPHRTYQCLIILTLIVLSLVQSAGNVWAGNNLWTAIGPAGGIVNTIVIDPNQPTILYAGANNGVYKSTDSGASWHASSQGLTDTYIHILIIDPTTPTTLYVGNDDGVFKSTDGGTTWQSSRTGIGATRVETLAIDSRNPTTLYAGASRVYKSTDAGANWTITTAITNTSGILALAIDPTNAAILYAGLYEGLFTSLDGGQTWSQLKNGLPANPRIYDLAINRANPQILYAGTDAGIFKSENKGASWSKVQDGSINTVAIDPTDSATVYAGTSAGIFKSSNHGASWGASNQDLAVRDVQAIAIDPHSTNLYVGTYGGGIFKSINRGENWAVATTGIINTSINALLIDPVTPTTLFAAASGGLLYKSTTGGLDWSLTTNGSALYIHALASHPFTSTILYAGTGNGPYKSTDGGVSWSRIYSCPIFCFLPVVTAFAVDPHTPSTVYWGSADTYLTNGTVAKSTTGGDSWGGSTGLPGTTVNTLAIDPQQPTTLYAGTDSGLYKSTDQAELWVPANVGLPTDVAVHALVIHPLTSTILYAGTASGVFKSSDGGATWRESGLTQGSVLALVIDPLNPANLYAARYDSIFYSNDNGASWGFFTAGLTTQHPTTLQLDPKTPTLLYAGTQNDGVLAMNKVEGLTITQQPASQTIPAGQSATLHVVAQGKGTLRYQWYQGSSGDRQNPVSGATADTYTTPPLTANATYWVQVSDDTGGRTDSVTAVLTLLTSDQPAILGPPASQTISLGQNVALRVTASGEPPLIYQWYQGQRGDISNLISGANTPEFTATALQNNTNFWVRVTDRLGRSSDSETAVIRVVTQLSLSAPSTVTATTKFPITVTALDSNKAAAPGYRGAISFASSDPQAQLPANYTFTVDDNGVHSFWSQLQTLGDQNLTARDLLVAEVTGMISVEVRAQPSPQQSWTLLIYAVGDNDLGQYMTTAIPDTLLARLRQAGPQPAVNLGILYDGPATNDTVRYILNQDGGWNLFPLSEARMDDPATLQDFIAWGFATFQSDYYYLSIVDHANGVLGIGVDRTSDASGQAFLTPTELRQAIYLGAGTGAHKLAIVHFDGCSFGLLENASIVQDLADYVIASPNTGWGIFAYDAYRRLAGQAANDPRSFAQAVARHYADKVGEQGRPYTISVFDMGHYGAVRAAVDLLGKKLASYTANSAARQNEVRAIRSTVQKYDSDDYQLTELDRYVDLRHLAAALQAQNVSFEEAAEVERATQSFVLLERHDSGTFQIFTKTLTTALTNAQGIGIYYPYSRSTNPGAYQRYISNQLFPNLTSGWGWTAFLASGIPPLLASEPEQPEVECLLSLVVADQRACATEATLFLPLIAHQ